MKTGSQPIPTRPWHLLVWLGIGLFGATQNVLMWRSQGMHHAWTALFLMQVLSWLPWAVATDSIIALGRRYPLSWPFSPGAWLVHLGFCSLITICAAAWVALIEKLANPWAIETGPGRFIPLWRSGVYSSILLSLCVYAAILLIAYLLSSREQLAQQQTQT